MIGQAGAGLASSAIATLARRQANSPRALKGWAARALSHALRASGLFDAYAYARACALTNASEQALIHHYLAQLPAARPSPQPLFDADRYRSLAGLSPMIDPFVHFATRRASWNEGLSADFDLDGYRRDNPDVRVSGWDPVLHYVARGWREGRFAPPPPAPLRPDFTGLGGRVDVGSGGVDVVIPVYRGHFETLVAIHRVLEARCVAPFRLVVIDDASPEPELSQDLLELEQRGLIFRLVNPANRGFTVTANRGLGLSNDRDVILLNADTEVFDGWLDRLQAHAYRAKDVGTVTPLSNAATILSYPITLRDNHARLELGHAELAALAAGLGSAPIDIPTGVGFCLYIRRACLEAVGPFDEVAFPRGYGEENDFCLRASALGWRHLAATDTYVRHLGSRSFGAERAALVAQGLKAIEARHPGYQALIGQFVARDPLAPARRALDLARIRRAGSSGRIVHDLEAAEGDLRIRRVAGPKARLLIDPPMILGAPNLPVFDPVAEPDAALGLLGALGASRMALRECPLLGLEQAAALKNLASALGMAVQTG